MVTTRRTKDEREADEASTALEADRGDAATIQEQAEEFASIDVKEINRGDEHVESGSPIRAETVAELDEVDTVVRMSIDRDPEAAASAEARRHENDDEEAQGPEDELQAPLERMMDLTTELSPDDLDGEAMDAQASSLLRDDSRDT